MSEYAQRDLIGLANHYTKHIEAMTAEGLHAKADIAAELAWRDAEIERLTAAVQYESDCVEAAKAEIERLTAERNALRDDNVKLNGWMEEEAQAAGRLQRKLNAAEEEIERLTAALQYEQHRAERIGTHGPGCADWGPAHYECAIRERDELRRQLAEAEQDAERIDWLETTLNESGELHLHDGGHPRGLGLGLLGRTLRAAIDAAMGASNA